MAITLQTNLILTALANMIGFVTTTNVQDMSAVEKLIDRATYQTLTFGTQALIQVADLPGVVDYSKNSSLLTVVEPEVHQTVIKIDTYKRIPLSISTEFLNGAFMDSYALQSFITVVLGTIPAAKTQKIFEEVLDKYVDVANNLPKATQKVEVLQIDVSKLTGKDLEAAKIENSKRIIQKLLAISNDLRFLSTDYTDTDFRTSFSPEKMHLIMPTEVDIEMLTNVYASLYNSDKIESRIDWSTTIDIPARVLKTSYSRVGEDPTDVDKLIGIFSYHQRVALLKNIDTMGSFYDRSNLMTNYHMVFGYGVNDVADYPCVLIVKKLEAPVTETP